MALVPKISVSFANDCSELVVTDTTKAYNASTNTGGWGAPNADTTDVTEAYIVIGNGSEESRYDVISELINPVTDSFELTTIADTYGDGEYTVTYNVYVGDTLYKCSIKIFAMCEVRCCINKMWLTYIENLGGESCDCGCSSDIKLNDVLKAEALYKSLTRAAGCLNAATRDKILSQLKKICSYYKCQCS